MLTAQLRALEKDGLIKRTIFAEVRRRWNAGRAECRRLRRSSSKS